MLVVASGLWLMFLLGGAVTAPTVDAGREFCGGSAVSVVRQGNGDLGGEPRTDQEAFDAACVQRAEARLRLIPVAGAAFVGAVVCFYVRRRRANAMRTRHGEGEVRTPFRETAGEDVSD